MKTQDGRDRYILPHTLHNESNISCFKARIPFTHSIITEQLFDLGRQRSTEVLLNLCEVWENLPLINGLPNRKKQIQ